MNPEKIEQRKLAMEVALKVTRDKKFPLVEYMQFDSKKEGASEETPGREPQVGSSLS